jgi:2'-5' RNA ligase
LAEPVVRAACNAAANVSLPSFEVTFDRSLSFRGKAGSRPFVLVGDDGPTPLKAFRGLLGTAMTTRGLGLLAKTNFTPHVTLLYDARSAEEYPVLPISWTVREFVLIHSANGHVPLARWPLCE